MKPHSPTYAAAFRCIGTACEDPCCSGWDIPVDKATYAKYQQLPKENIGSLVSTFVVINPAATHDNLYAKIIPTPTGACPFFDSDHLCGIQRNYGADLLPATCSIYPRALRLVDNTLEGSLSLSCPEAARNVLLEPTFIHTQANLFSGDFRTDSFFHLTTNPHTAPLQPYLHPIRSLLLDIVRDRTHPLWQRILWIGAFCTDLDRCLETPSQTPALLSTYEQSLPNDQLWLALEKLPTNTKLRLEIILTLTNERLADPGSGKRLRDTFWDFIEGIAAPDPTLPADDLHRFTYAEETYYRPFFANSPHILENYLINYIYQHLFPFGREGASTRGFFDEYLLLATQFAWINTLLIGISANHKQSFSGEHVVRTVQSFIRAVEHYPEVLNLIPEYMKTRNLANLQGMAILLRP
jgi:lysine-N-methylase